MAIDLRREFAGVALSAGGKVFAPRPLPSGDLEATRATGGALAKRFNTLGQAIDIETQSLLDRGDAIKEFGGSLQRGGTQIGRAFREVEERQLLALNRQRAETAKVQYLRDANGIIDAATKEVGADGDLTQAVRKALEERGAELLDGSGVDGDEARTQLESDLRRTAIGVELQAQKLERRRKGQFLQADLDRRIAGSEKPLSQTRGALQATLLQERVTDIRRAVGEGTITPVDGERRIAALREAVLKGTIATDASTDPAGALARLNRGEYQHLFANDFEEAAARETIKKGIVAARVEARKQEVLAYQQRISDFEVVNPSEDDVEGAYANGKGWLKPGDRTRLVKAARVRRKAVDETNAAILLVDQMFRGGAKLDPNDPDHKKAFDAHFRQNAQNLTTGPQAMRKTADYVAAGGFFPKTLKSGMSARLRSGTDDEKLEVAQFAELAARDNPAILTDFNNGERRFMGMVARLAAGGMSAERAVNRATDAIFKADEPERVLRRKRRADEKHSDEFNGWLSDAFTRGFEFLPGVDVTALPDALMAEFGEAYNAHYDAVGDMEVAKDLALKEMQEVWGVATVGGRRMMKYAPSVMYAVPGEDPEWIGEQLRTELISSGAFAEPIEDRVILVDDEITAREKHPKTGKPWPSYSVLLKDLETGVLEPLRRPDGGVMRWRPDWQTSPAKGRKDDELRAELERVRELDVAVREKLRLMAGTPAEAAPLKRARAIEAARQQARQ